MFYENIIIGGGPAGLQCAYFFKKHNINYTILEKTNISGSFFNSYPHTGSLISINRKYTGNDNKDFNLRHDWNSLLNDEGLLFTDYDNKFYPKRESLVKYLNDFANFNKLNILYNKSVYKIKKTDLKYQIFIKKTKEIYSCNKLIIATGLSKQNIPSYVLNVHDPIKHYGEYPIKFFMDSKNLEEFKNKNILILGSGNASFELGNVLNEVSSSIFILGKSNREWALSTHYSGDIRSIYLPFMDTFLLKSLNAIDCNQTISSNNLIITQDKKDDPYNIQFLVDGAKIPLLSNGRNSYDKIILCTGWKFDNSIFDFDVSLTLNNKYPHIKNNYESINNKNLYFIGSLMHSFDYRKSSGGFIHGFRYLIKTFINLNYNISFETLVFNFENINDCNTVVNHIIYRINNSSDLYQMFGYMADIFYYDLVHRKIYYYNNVPVNSHNPSNTDNKLFFILTLEYGDKVTNILEIGRKQSNVGTESKSTLIHPVLKIYNSNPLNLIDIIHFDEDLFAEYTDREKYYDKLFRVLKSYL